MFYISKKLFYAIVIFGTWTCLCDEWNTNQQRVLDELIPLLYMGYRKTLDSSSNENTVTFRRVLKNNKEYNIHVHKLKDVNGFKWHNLIVKEKSSDDPLIYVNNPVETKIPNAYLSLERFKELLTGRILKQRNEFKERYFKSTSKHTFATIKHARHFKIEQKKTLVLTKPKERSISKHISNITKTTNKPKIQNISNKNATTKIVIKHEKDGTSAAKSSLQLKLTSKLDDKAKKVSTEVIKQETTNKPDNVIPTIASINKLKKNSNANKSNNEHYMLRTNRTNTIITKDIVKAIAKSVTNESDVIKTTANLVVAYVTKESQKTKERSDLRTIYTPTSKALNIDDLTTVKETTTEEPTTVEPSTNELKKSKEPTTEDFTSTEPATTDLASTEVFITIVEPTSGEPTTEKHTTEGFTSTELATKEIFTTKATTEESTSKEPATEELATKELFTAEPTTEESTTEPATEEPTTGELFTTGPITEESTSTESATVEANTEELFTTEPRTEMPTTTEPTIEEPTTEELTTTLVRLPRRTGTRRSTTTVRTTTMSKRVTLGRPMVFMGDWGA